MSEVPLFSPGIHSIQNALYYISMVDFVYFNFVATLACGPCGRITRRHSELHLDAASTPDSNTLTLFQRLDAVSTPLPIKDHTS